MPPSLRKKLIETALPLEAIDAAAAQEKSARHGHPSTLHLWWARRPLAACRSAIFAQLVDDPSARPDLFPTPEAQEAERRRLFALMADLARWENSADEALLERARAEIRASCGEPLPPLCDPFSGGGSIPLEAQRLGLPAQASDLNPVAALIGKALIEIPWSFRNAPPRHPGAEAGRSRRDAEGLAEEVEYYGAWMREEALARIGGLYPKAKLPPEQGGGEASVVAWIWARAVPSPDPAFAEAWTPLASSFLLSARRGEEIRAEPLVERKTGRISWRLRRGGTAKEIAAARKGTKTGRGSYFRCLFSGAEISPEYLAFCGAAGRMRHMLLAIVAEGKGRRIFLPPEPEHERVAASARPAWRPEGRMGENPRWFAPPAYGLTRFGDLFTDRQLVALKLYGDLVHEARILIELDALAAGASPDPTPLREGGTGAKAWAEAVSVYLALGVSRLADISNAFCVWSSSADQLVHLFGRQAIPMAWDFAEAGLFAGRAGDYRTSLRSLTKVLRRLRPAAPGVSFRGEAQNAAYPRGAAISADPPYYDNIGYADLSEFFFCWLKPALSPVYPELFEAPETPKAAELVASSHRHGGKAAAEAFFLQGMSAVFANMAAQDSGAYPATIYYAFKQREAGAEGLVSPGWAAFLEALTSAGYALTAAWPIRTERPVRLISTGVNALARALLLVCRKRDPEAGIISRAEFLEALRRELPPALEALRAAGIAPADLPQSAIGPGFGIFSRQSAVLEPDGRPMRVRTALELIDAELAAQSLGGLSGPAGGEADFDPETRFALNWFARHGSAWARPGEAEDPARLQQALQAGILQLEAEKIRLTPRAALPAPKASAPVWSRLQALLRLHEAEGASAKAAALLQKRGGKPEAVKALAYRLHELSERRGEASGAAPYNALIADWSLLTAKAPASVLRLKEPSRGGRPEPS